MCWTQPSPSPHPPSRAASPTRRGKLNATTPLINVAQAFVRSLAVRPLEQNTHASMEAHPPPYTKAGGRAARVQIPLGSFFACSPVRERAGGLQSISDGCRARHTPRCRSTNVKDAKPNWSSLLPGPRGMLILARTTVFVRIPSIDPENCCRVLAPFFEEID